MADDSSLMTSKRNPLQVYKLAIVCLLIGAILATCSIVVGKKSVYPECNFRPAKLNQVDRGFPLAYFRVTPSPSDCVAVEEVSAVIKVDVGNEIKLMHFVADIIIWSLLPGAVLLFANRRNKRLSS
jgi:hypothetical protein